MLLWFSASPTVQHVQVFCIVLVHFENYAPSVNVACGPFKRTNVNPIDNNGQRTDEPMHGDGLETTLAVALTT